MFGSFTAGFDDYTEDWGGCSPRVMGRNPLFVSATADYLNATGISHSLAATWDDWTEGSHFEPDVNDGTSMLVALKQGLGKIAGEKSDPNGDSGLNTRYYMNDI